MNKKTEVLVRGKGKRGKIPRELIYEMVRGSTVYYRDCNRVLAGEKSLEEVMVAVDCSHIRLYSF